MPTKLQELLQERAEAITTMKRMLDTADDAHRSMTGAEDKEYKELDKKVDAINEQLAKRSKIEGFDPTANIVNPFPTFLQGGHQESRDSAGFKNLAEMLWAIKEQKSGRRDERLDLLREKREQTMGTGSQGGFALPSQFSSDVRMAPNQGGIVRPRATVIPAGDPPDAELDFPSLDQTSGKNNYGGVILSHSGEGITLTETDLALRQISMTPKEISAYLVTSNKLLRNWSAGGVFITTMLRNACTSAEDWDFLRGTGINMSIGVINSPCAITYNRAAAGNIDFPDVYGMLAKVKMGGSPVWLASQTIIPELASMTDAGGHAVWLGSQGDALKGAAGPMPSTLMGLPLYFADRLPALGSKGDLVLADLSYYVVKDGSGPFVDLSEHIYFTSDKSVFRIVWNVDGKPWLTEPLQLEGATGTTVSPFVVLDTP
jgi:HK97 family phage major capsid protein